MKTLPVAAASFAAGAAFHFFGEKWLVAGVFAVLAALVFCGSGEWKGKAACLFFCVPGFFFAFSETMERDSLRSFAVPFEGRRVFVRGTVLSSSPSRSGFRLEVDVSGLSCGGVSMVAPKGFRVVAALSSGGAAGTPEPGCGIGMSGILVAVSARSNPPLPSYAEFLAARHVFHVLSGASVDCCSAMAADSLRGLAVFLRGRMKSGISVLHSPERAAVICGVAFGDKSLFTERLSDMFRRAGTLHVLAASGFNVSLVSSFFLFFARRAGLGPAVSFLLVLPLILSYVFVAGESPSVVRAGIMSAVGFLASAIGRDYDLASSLAFAVIAMIAACPAVVSDCGFQLSVGAVAGICLFMDFVRPCLPVLPRPLSFVLESVALSLSVEAVTVPVCAFSFCAWCPVSSLSNVPTAPIAALVLSSGLLEGLLHVVFEPAAFIPAILSDFSAGLMISVQGFFSSLPFSFVNVCAPLPWLLASYYCVVLFAVLRGGVLSVLRLLPIAWLSLLALPGLFPSFPDGRATVVFFDVGDADSCFVRTAEGRTALIDCGPSGKDGGLDAGAAVVSRYLRKRGVDRVDFVFLTHEHDDHAGGFGSVRANLPVGRVLVPPAMEGVWPGEAFFRGCEVRLSPSAAVRAVHPERGDFPLSPNDSSLVLMLEISGRRILMCADVERGAESLMLKRGVDLDADVLKVAHHGSSTSSSPGFVEAVSPSLCVVSADGGRKKGHPSREVLSVLGKSGSGVLVTGGTGAVVLEIESDGRMSVISSGPVPFSSTFR